MQDPAGFTFTRREYAALINAIEREDAPAHAYARDLERLGHAFLAASADGVTVTEPLSATVREDLEAFIASAGAVAGPLYRLPADLRALLTLRLVSERTSRRALDEVERIVGLLEDLAGIASRLLDGKFDGPAGTSPGPGKEPALLLLRAAAQAYRNAFNIRVGMGGRPCLRAALAVLLEALAERGSSEAAALRAGLDRALAEALDVRAPAA